MNSKSTDNTCECHFGKIDSEMDSSYNVTEKLVRPSLAKRLAAAAMVTTTMMAPLRDLIGAIQPQVDIMEIACSPESALAQEFLNHGYVGQRINYKTGFDLDSKKGTNKLLGEISEKRPRLAWASMMCTRMSGLQNLTPRSPEEMDRFLKRRGQDLRRCDEVVSGLELVLQDGGDVAWEWPTTAVAGWKSKPLQRLQKLIRKHRQQAYWVKIDGCQYGLEWRGTPVKKSWTILTSNRNLWLTLNKLCDGTHEHAHCRGPVAQASSFYPSKMCKDILKAMKFTSSQQNQFLEKLAETYLLHIKTHPEENFDHGLPHHGLQPLQAQPEQEVLALSRTRLHLETAPAGKKLEAVKQMMLRVHRASGHSGMSNLVQLLKARGAPPWALELASRLRCPECEEAAKPLPRPPASLGETPGMFEVLGTDVFEFELSDLPDQQDNNKKMKFILWRDRASGLTMIDHLQTYEGKGAWEPTTQDVIKSMAKWQMTYPSPKWEFSDAARYYTSAEMMDYLNRGGIGHTVAPAQAHWLLGHEEAAIGVAKRTVLRLLRENSKFPVQDLFTLAAGAMNSHVGPSGYSAFQWAFGAGGGILA